MNVFSYFPSLIYRDERPDLMDKVLTVCSEHFDNLRTATPNFLQTENLVGHESLREFENYILLNSVEILRQQGYDVSKYDFYISSLWGQELNKNSGTNVHIHSNSQICGWFFLETSENGSFPFYHDTRLNKTMIELNTLQTRDVTVATNNIIFDNVVPGTVLFNNSWMQHQLTANQSDTPTKCIHFIVCHRDILTNTLKM